VERLWAQSIWFHIFFYFYYFSVTAASTIVLVRCIKTAPSDIKKSKAAVILVGVFCAVLFWYGMTDVPFYRSLNIIRFPILPVYLCAPSGIGGLCYWSNINF